MLKMSLAMRCRALGQETTYPNPRNPIAAMTNPTGMPLNRVISSSITPSIPINVLSMLNATDTRGAVVSTRC